MEKLLSDKFNLLILQNVCSGNGLEVNLGSLSKRLRKHRNTVRERVRSLLSHKIIDRPVVPFLGLFKEYPLLVAVYADLPSDKEAVRWIVRDPKIFAAFKVREGEYDMLLFEFHKDILDYYTWREQLVSEGSIPVRRERTPSEALYFSNNLILKYEPSAAVHLIGEKVRREGRIQLNDYVLDKFGFNVLSHLIKGEGMRINENFLSKKVGIHRSTIRKRILRMQEQQLILPPLCRFPLFFVPTSLLLVFSMLEVKNFKDKFMQDILVDPHVSLAYKISRGKYNFLLFECHESIEGYLQWEEMYERKYSSCFGSIKNNYLSPNMTLSIDQQKVSLGIIQEKLRQINT